MITFSFQLEGVRLFNEHNFVDTVVGNSNLSIENLGQNLKVFENGERNAAKQVGASVHCFPKRLK